jgi:hypothetical protein
LKRFNQFLDQLSNYLAHRKGLLPMVGVLMVGINFIFQLIPGMGWLASSNLFLHLGVILSIVGMMLAWAL